MCIKLGTFLDGTRRADAHRKQQKEKQEQPEISGEQATTKNLPTPGNQDQRRTLKFGFSKMTPSKVSYINTTFCSADMTIWK